MKHLIDTFNQASMHDASEYILKLYEDVSETKEKDNRGFWINRPLFSHSSLPDVLGTTEIPIHEFKFDEPFIYCVYVHHNINLWAKYIHKIPNIILDKVRSGDCKLIFDDTMEGSPCDKFLNIIYKSIDTLKLPPEQLYFITNNLLAEKTHEDWKGQNKDRLYMNVISFMWNVYDIQRLKKINLPDSVNIKTELIYKRDNLDSIKHFLKVNRTDRFERNLFMLHMNKNNMLDNSLLSFPQLPDMNYNDQFKTLTTIDNINSLRSKTPFHIDNTDKTNVGEAGHKIGQFNADLPFQPMHYRKSLISLVMCAFPFDDNACHLHSSTYNPMFCGHPVNQFGPYQHLKEMRNNGFKTFSKWWDESYDDEKDHWKRFRKVMNVSYKISKMSIEDVFKMVVEMRGVLQHNSDLINNYNVDDNLIKKIFKT